MTTKMKESRNKNKVCEAILSLESIYSLHYDLLIAKSHDFGFDQKSS